MLYCPYLRLIGVGRLINPDYQKFTDVLLTAQKNFTLENKVKIFINDNPMIHVYMLAGQT